MWILFALLSGSCAAIIAILVKLFFKQINPLFITFIFSLMTMLMLIFIDFFTQKVGCKMITTLNYRDLALLLFAGFLNGFAFICYLTALGCGQTGGVIALDRLGIVFALILAAIFLQESFTLKAALGSLFMILGAFLIGS